MKESQLENKTAIATNDYVRMVDENGNSVKIKKDSFMAAIRDALPSIISDGATGGGSVLSIINGTLKTRTDANLASVLGAVTPKGVVINTDIDTLTASGAYRLDSSCTNLPSSYSEGQLIVISSKVGIQTVTTQYYVETYGDALFQRTYWYQGWSNWVRCDNFGCSTLADLASLLGGYPTNHALVQISNSNKTGLELAKEYYTNQMQEDEVAFLFITPSDANVFTTIYKEVNVGRIEIHATNGTTTIYKKGYNDSDFVLVQ